MDGERVGQNIRTCLHDQLLYEKGSRDTIRWEDGFWTCSQARVQSDVHLSHTPSEKEFLGPTFKEESVL